MIKFETDAELLLPWLIAAGMLIAGFIAIKIISRIVKRTLKKTALDAALHRFIYHGVGGACWIVLIGTILSYLGVPLSTFITVLGVAGAAIALSLKDSLSNIAGGVIIMISQPFKKGDFIETGSEKGSVDGIDLLMTTLLTVDNKVVHIPNGMLSTSVIINYSSEDRRRVDCVFGIGASSSVSKAKDILSAVTEQNEMILDSPAPVIGVADQSDGIVFIDMKVWCMTNNYAAVKYFIEETVKAAFDEAGIETPIPHINVHTKK